jgi:hypothetical protein
MDDSNDARDSTRGPQQSIAGRWRWTGAHGAKWRMPVPPGPPPELSKAEREQEARTEARGVAIVTRLHLVGLFSAGVVVTGLVLAAVIVMLVLVLLGHH